MNEPKKSVWKDRHSVQEEMDQLFNQFRNLWTSPLLSVNRIWRPPTDVLEFEDEIVVRMEIAGVQKEKISITVKDNVLMLRGTRQKELERADCAYRNMELTYGRFERNILMPESADPDRITAVYKDGFLEITIKKTPIPPGVTREIEITDE